MNPYPGSERAVGPHAVSDRHVPVPVPVPVQEGVPLAPHQAAGLVWPAVDRVFRSGMAAAGDRGGAELRQRYGGPSAIGFLVDFRTRLAAPGGFISGRQLAALTRYADQAECQRYLDKQVAHGMIHRQDDGICATDRGRAYLTELYELHARVTEEIWSEHTERVQRLVGVLGRLLAAALDGPPPGAATPPAPSGHLPPPVIRQPGVAPAPRRPGGPEHRDGAFDAMAPPYEPDGTPPGLLLLNRLGTLRYHRADAHAAAWQAAGHTARSIVALAPGPERLAIELETDRRAAGPYAVLTPPERLQLLADLAALPG
ncbi:hypothetical protein [Plantactinospora sonchi]|uniref:MarR family transcriptional regulator n=1 Tax=Plantactinospora sonchi TaxID=1544735 RepID=A0ABU7RQ35_9ACTN